MNAHIRKVYVPMTETGFYILLCLRHECHGYHIVKEVEALKWGDYHYARYIIWKFVEDGKGWSY